MADRSYINISEGTTANNALALCGCTPACFLGTTATANNSNCLGGIASTGYGRAHGQYSFGTGGVGMTTSTFVSCLSSIGAFSQYYFAVRGTWSYAGNGFICDSGLEDIQIAGSTIEVIGNSSEYTIRIITPTTGCGGLSSEYIYVNNGAGYSPGWRKQYNSSNDGVNSGLDADLLDGVQGACYAQLASPTFTGVVTLTNYDGGLTFSGFGSTDCNWYVHGPLGAGDDIFYLHRYNTGSYNMCISGAVTAPIVYATNCFSGNAAGLTGTANSLTAGAATTANNSTCFGGLALTQFVYGGAGTGSNSATAATYNPYEMSQYKSGFWEVTGAAWTPTADWYWGLTAAHTSNSPSYNYSMNIIAKYGNGGCDYYARTVDNGTPNGWKKIAVHTDASNNTLDVPTINAGSGFISSGSYGGTGCAARFPAGIYSDGPNYLYGTVITNGTLCINNSCYSISNTGAATFCASVTSPTICATTIRATGTLELCGGNTNVINLVTDSAYVLRGLNSSCTSLYYAGNEKLKTLTNGACICGCGFATDFISGSDCRLKTDIQPITCALSVVEKLQGVYYKLNEHEECNVGLIAQDVLPILPEVVSCGEYYGIKYDKLTALLIEAIKEQNEKITNLELEIEKLKTC